jgi:hypothetical protein
VIQRRSKVSDDAIHSYLKHSLGVVSRKDIKPSDLNDVLAWCEERGALADL